MKRNLMWTVGLLVLASFASSLAADRQIPLDSARVIAREDGEARVVLKASDLSFLTGRLVKRASLVIPVGARTAPRDLNLYIYAAGRSWDAGSVGWDHPWRRAGGEWNLDHYQIVQITSGGRPGELRFDVSSILREIAEGREPNVGFFLLPDGGEEGGRFTPEDRQFVGSLQGAYLEVSTTRMPRARL